MENKLKFDQQYTIVNNKTLGEGSYGKVFLCKSNQNQNQGNLVAKIQWPNKENNQTYEELEKKCYNEFQITQNLKHQNIVQQLNFIPNQDLELNQQKYKTVIIISEYFPNRLYDFIMKQKLPVNAAYYFFQQLISGIEFLHQNNICHRDLKPENLMVDKDCTLKIIDFGFAIYLDQQKNESLQESLQKGSGVYRCPEIVEQQGYNGVSADIFSCAVILFTLLTRQFPYEGAQKSDEYYVHLINKSYEKYWKPFLRDPYLKKIFNDDLRDLFQKMFSYDPQERLSINEIKNHKWMKEQQKNYEDKQKDTQEELKLLMEYVTIDNKKKQEGQNNLDIKFRSICSSDEIIQEIEDQFGGDLYKDRYLGIYDQNTQNINNILSVKQPQQLLLIILKQLYTNNQQADIDLDENYYQIKYTYDEDNYNLQQFIISFTKKSEQMTCIEFTYLQGDYLGYLLQIQQIIDQIQNE